MSDPRKLISVKSIGGEIHGTTESGAEVSLGRQMEGRCAYFTCRARNLCKAGHCVGRNLKHRGYIIENGKIERENHESISS